MKYEPSLVVTHVVNPVGERRSPLLHVIAAML